MTQPDHQDSPRYSTFTRSWNAYCRGEEEDWRPDDFDANDPKAVGDWQLAWCAAAGTNEGRQHRAVAKRAYERNLRQATSRRVEE